MKKYVSKRKLREQVQGLKSDLRLAQSNEKDAKESLEHEIERKSHKPFGFTITENEGGGFNWVTWRTVERPGYRRMYWEKEYHAKSGKRMPHGTAKSAYAAELKARKALVPFQTEAIQVTKGVC